MKKFFAVEDFQMNGILSQRDAMDKYGQDASVGWVSVDSDRKVVLRLFYQEGPGKVVHPIEWEGLFGIEIPVRLSPSGRTALYYTASRDALDAMARALRAWERLEEDIENALAANL